MGLSCSCYEYDGDGWFWLEPYETTLATKYSRKCCSCGAKVKPGETVVVFPRYRGPNSEIEERIMGEEINIASWHMCERCGDMFWSLDELGFCVNIGEDSMRELTREYAEMYGPKKVA